MSLPQFTAEMALSEVSQRYRGKRVIRFSFAGAIPMQEPEPSAALASRFWPPPFYKRVPCCLPDPLDPGRPRCTYSYLPVWWNCAVLSTPYACWICSPPQIATQG